MRTLTIKLAAGVRNEITAPGNFLHLVESSAALDIELDNGMRLQDMLAGTWAEPGDFQRIALTSATAQTIRLLVSKGGKAGVFRVAGDVSVINGEVVRTKNNRAFLGSGWVGASVGNYTHIQMHNSAAKSLIVESVNVFSGAAALVYLMASNAAIGALLSSPASKKVLAAASAAQMRSLQAAAISGTYLSTLALAVANESKFIPLSSPLVVEPGNSLIVVNAVTNTALGVAIEFYEDE